MYPYIYPNAIGIMILRLAPIDKGRELLDCGVNCLADFPGTCFAVGIETGHEGGRGIGQAPSQYRAMVKRWIRLQL